MELRIKTPRWALPLLQPSRYKAVYGGRGSGKSHFFAELLVERCVAEHDLSCVCIREIQKSLKFSAKKLIEQKISSLGVSDLFEITLTEIRRIGGRGIIIFQGMQDHTADSIKSLEGFGIAWVEEAQSLSARSLELLRPTIRAEGSELWFSWNPDQPEDAVDSFFRGDKPPKDAVIAKVNYDQNPFLPKTLYEEMLADRERDPDSFVHVWEGEYNTRSEAQIFRGKFSVMEFEPGKKWDGPYFGADWGFSQDPTALIKFWIHDKNLWIEQESYHVGLDIDKTPAQWGRDIPGCDKYVVRADNARPETISYMKRHGFPRIEGASKWKGCVEDGVAHMRSYKKIIIHPACPYTAREMRLYSYKINKAGDILADIEDANNHAIDAIRYGLDPLITRSTLDYSKLVQM